MSIPVKTLSVSMPDRKGVFGQGGASRRPLRPSLNPRPEDTTPAALCSRATTSPQREKLIEAARRREIDLVLVWRLDRWVRSLVDLVNPLQELNALDVGFMSLSEALDLTTPSGRALAHPVAKSGFDRTVDPSRSGRRRGERERIKSRADPTRADH